MLQCNYRVTAGERRIKAVDWIIDAVKSLFALAGRQAGTRDYCPANWTEMPLGLASLQEAALVR
jgi:hypothetical protein